MKVTHLAVVILLCCANLCSQQNQRPSRGSIDFGTEEPPIKVNQEQIGTFRNIFVHVAERVTPSVVSVVPTRVDTIEYSRNPFYRFFEESPEPQQQERRTQGLGSGFIVSSKGYILTNYHVIAGAEEIEVRLANGNTLPAEVVGSDSLSDIAVIRITGTIPSDLTVAHLGNSDSLKPGDWIAAIGNPFALTSTVTAGIVSALGRQVAEPLAFQNFIQTDAAINPGNSGGPLVNVEGSVMGINTLIFSRTGGFMGVGFAIPINLARRVMEDLIYEGRVIRGYVGISIQEITPELRDALGLETLEGALVADVVPGQPAAEAGIRAGDIILTINNRQIENANELRNVIAAVRPGEEVQITLSRNGKEVRVTVRPIERTPDVLQQQQQSTQPQPRPQRGPVNNRLGIGVEQISSELRNRLNIPDNVRGVLVVRLAPDVTDERTILLPGDIITRAKVENSNWVSIGSERDFRRFAQGVKSNQAVVLQIYRNGQTFFVSFSVN